MIKKWLFYLGCFFALSIFFQCKSNSSLAGGTDMPNETKSVISGFVVDANGKAVSSARVYLYRSATINLNESAWLDTTHTNSRGQFFFNQIAVGKYQILSRSQDSSLAMVIPSIQIGLSRDTVFIGDTARTVGSISGSIDVPPAKGINIYAVIENMPYAGIVDSTGAFRLSHLPSGPHFLMLLVGDTSGSVIAAESVLVVEKINTDLGKIKRFDFLTSPSPMVFENFEDSSRWNANFGSWWAFNDSGINAQHSASNFNFADTPGANASTYCGHAHIDLDPKATLAFGGTGTHLGPATRDFSRSYDFSKLKRISFASKGSGNQVVFELFSDINQTYIQFASLVSSPSEWVVSSISVDSVVASLSPEQQNNWLRVSPYLSRIQWRIIKSTNAPLNADLWLDDIEFEF